MSNALSLPEQPEFWSITPQGINIVAGTPENEWRGLAKAALDILEVKHREHAEIMFIVGDILAYGDMYFHETYADVIDATRQFIGKNIKTLQNAAWVAKKIKPHIRKADTLSLSIHAEVAALPEEEQVAFLTAAEEENLTVSELRKKVKEAHPEKAPAKSTKPKNVAVVDLADETGITHGLDLAARFVDDQPQQPDEWSKERLRAWMPSIKILIHAFAKTDEGAKACLAEGTAYLNEHAPELAKWSDSKREKWNKATAGLQGRLRELSKDPM